MRFGPQGRAVFITRQLLQRVPRHIHPGVRRVEGDEDHTGASYLSLPGILLGRMGYRLIGEQRVVFVATATWKITDVRMRLQGRERTVLAFLSAEGAPSLLGAPTLQTFGLGVDPLARRLVPVDAYLAQARSTPPAAWGRRFDAPADITRGRT
jgi:predicted aspartyl protease